MKDWKQIEVPAYMQGLPKDKRGFPIPVTVVRDKQGIPDFRLRDAEQTTRCILDKRCALCGQPLQTDIWLVAGAKIALDSRGAYIEPPLHQTCGVYALQVCPYLAVSSFVKRLTDTSSPSVKGIQALPGKPAVFGLVKTTNYHAQLSPQGIWYLIPVRPFLDMMFWKESQPITRDLAQSMLHE